MKSEQMTGIILAGGKNSRMGTDKAFLEMNGCRLIDRTVGLFRRLQFGEILIVTNSPLSYLDQRVTLVTDILKNRGALGGIYTGLFFAAHEKSFVCACDMPFLNAAFISYMIDRADNYDIVVPKSTDGLQPLHSIYDKKCLPAIKNLLDHERLKIADFFKGLRVLTIEHDILRTFDPEGKMFFNINTPADFQNLLQARHQPAAKQSNTAPMTSPRDSEN